MQLCRMHKPANDSYEKKESSSPAASPCGTPFMHLSTQTARQTCWLQPVEPSADRAAAGARHWIETFH
jgi:hypothetical protein